MNGSADSSCDTPTVASSRMTEEAPRAAQRTDHEPFREQPVPTPTASAMGNATQ